MHSEIYEENYKHSLAKTKWLMIYTCIGFATLTVSYVNGVDSPTWLLVLWGLFIALDFKSIISNYLDAKWVKDKKKTPRDLQKNLERYYGAFAKPTSNSHMAFQFILACVMSLYIAIGYMDYFSLISNTYVVIIDCIIGAALGLAMCIWHSYNKLVIADRHRYIEETRKLIGGSEL